MLEWKQRENEEMADKVKHIYEVFPNAYLNKEAVEELFKQTFNQ